MSSPRRAIARPGAPSPTAASASISAASASGSARPQRRRHGVMRERREAEQPAARADRRQQPLGRMADEQEERVRRRLLEILEQGIGGTALEIVDRVDHHRPPGRHRGGGREQPLQAAHLIDVDASGRARCRCPWAAAPAASDRDGCRRRPAGRRDDRRARRGRARRPAAPPPRQARAAPPCRRTAPCRPPPARRAARRGGAGPVSSAARKAATAASWPKSGVTEQILERGEQARGHRLRPRLRRATIRKRSGSSAASRRKAAGDAVMIAAVLRAPIRSPTPPSRANARRAGVGRRQIEQQGAVGERSAAADLVERADRRRRRRRRRRPDRPASCRRSDRTAPTGRASSAGRMVRATWSARAAANSSASVSGVQRSTSPCSSRPRIASRPGAAARLAGVDDVDAARPQRCGQRRQLGRFADPLPAFERDEAAGHGRHAAPNRLFRPVQMRPKKPASPTAVSATSGVTCGGMPSPVSTTRSAICWPCAIGACTGPLIDDPRADVLAEPGRIGDRDRPRRDQADAGAVAALDLRLADPLALAEQGPRLPGVEAPVHEAHRFLDPLVEAGQAGDDHHDPPAVLLGRAGEAEAGLLGMAGLQAVGAVDPAEQGIAIALGDRLVARPSSGPR